MAGNTFPSLHLPRAELRVSFLWKMNREHHVRATRTIKCSAKSGPLTLTPLRFAFRAGLATRTEAASPSKPPSCIFLVTLMATWNSSCLIPLFTDHFCLENTAPGTVPLSSDPSAPGGGHSKGVTPLPALQGRQPRPDSSGQESPGSLARPHARSRLRGGRRPARASRAALTHHLDPADGARIALHVPAPHGHGVPLLEREHFVASRLGACAPGVRGQGASFLAVFHVGHGYGAEPAMEALGRGRRAAMAALWGRPTGHSAGHSAARRPPAALVPATEAARDWLARTSDVTIRAPGHSPHPLPYWSDLEGWGSRGRQRAEVRPVR